MVVVLAMALMVSGVLSAYLGRGLAEGVRVDGKAARERAEWRARSELEVALRKVSRAIEAGSIEGMVEGILENDPPLVPGTCVALERVPDTQWYRLSAVSPFDKEVGIVQCYLRNGRSYSTYNYYVEDGGLGISGQPTGRIHANGPISFYFQDGTYADYVSSSSGFEYRNGATEENTTLLGGFDQEADEKHLLDSLDFALLETEATYVSPPDLTAVVVFDGEDVQVQLYTKSSTIQVEATGYNSVYTGDALQLVGTWVYIGDALVEVTVNVYEWQDQEVQQSHTELVWVPYSGTNAGTGTDVSGGGDGTGYWDTVTVTETVIKSVKVKVGTTTEMQMKPQYEWQEVEQWVPQYEQVPYTYLKNVTVPPQLYSQTSHPADGIFYFQDDVTVSGDLNGSVTIVSADDIDIKNNLRYVDDSDETAYLNGSDPSQPYQPNPDFVRDGQGLALIAMDQIRYSKSCPTNLEINGALVAAGGYVGMSGVSFDAQGTPYTSSSTIKGAIRRFGSIMSMQQPVATLLDQSGQLKHGFKSGSSVYDPGLANSPPPGMPTEEGAQVGDVLRIGGLAGATFGTLTGTETIPVGYEPIDGMLSVPELRDLAALPGLDWGAVRTRLTTGNAP